MTNSSQIKSRAFSGIIWKFAERVSAQLVSLIVSIILARILLPDDYSVVSIVTIFFTFCNIFISSGFNTALIQKKNADIIDYSSVLFVSMFISAILYIVMFFTAPLIADLYNKSLLIPIIRVMSVTFFINAFKGVVCAKISSDLNFRSFFWATIIGTLISAIVGIIMALNGFGPWALVAQQMTNSTIDTIILTIVTKVKFKFIISFKRLKELFNYGWKIFVSSIISVIYDEIKPLIIGVKFSSVDLAFYNKGRSFPALINGSICDTISAVLFPVMSKLQDNKEEVLTVSRRYMRVSSYIVFPMLIGFLAISDNFIKLLLTEKWLFASPYIKIFCIAFMFNIIQTGNLQIIRAIGRSDIILKLEIIKKILYFIIVVAFIFLSESPYLLAASEILCAVIATIVNTYPTVKLVNYSYKMLFTDLFPNLLIASIMGFGVWITGNISLPLLLLIILQVSIGLIIYLIFSIISKNENFNYLLNFIKERKKG